MKRLTSFLGLLLVFIPTLLRAQETRPQFIRLAEDDAASRQEMQALLDRYHVPGISLAVIDKGKIAWERGYGVVTPGGKPVTAQTRFQAGSVSKPVTALGTLHLVQEGKLALDTDLNRYLVSWKIPDNHFTEKSAVTLRETLAHRAGFIQPSEGWRGYAEGERLPTLVQILCGQPPANSPAAVIDIVPGTQFRYSNCGYLAIQQAIIDVTGKPFPDEMEMLVLKPLGMRYSTFRQPAPAGFGAIAAVGHDLNGQPIEGKWHAYPEMAAAGLWTTAGDLGRFIIGVQHACHGDRDAILGLNLCGQMLTPQDPNGRFGEDYYGLGFQLGGHPVAFFWHGGGTAGFYAYFVGYTDTGQGAAILANGKNSGELIQIVIHSIAKEYGWGSQR